MYPNNLKRVDSTFQIIIPEEIQNPSIQKWLQEHFWQKPQRDDSILTNIFRNEAGFELTIVTFPPGVRLVRIEGVEAITLFMTLFYQTEAQAQKFFDEFGQLLLYVLRDGTRIYHTRPLSTWWARIAIEFPPSLKGGESHARG